MTSRLDRDFIKQFARLSTHVQTIARRNYLFWLEDRSHPSLDYKPVHPSLPIYSVRIGAHHRAVGARRDDGTAIVWFFIGSHAEYDKLLTRLRPSHSRMVDGHR